ncbi:hypothetical protein C8J57DRAFT_1290901 [Mycena rebaudengoi]|nr:hypothetical protein C8J57DRAFT_1290901 [Mycena rebaudengoi]
MGEGWRKSARHIFWILVTDWLRVVCFPLDDVDVLTCCSSASRFARSSCSRSSGPCSLDSIGAAKNTTALASPSEEDKDSGIAKGGAAVSRCIAGSGTCGEASCMDGTGTASSSGTLIAPCASRVLAHASNSMGEGVCFRLDESFHVHPLSCCSSA